VHFLWPDGRCHPEVELRANLKPISQRCHPTLVAFAWELTKETLDLPLGCLQGGDGNEIIACFSFSRIEDGYDWLIQTGHGVCCAVSLVLHCRTEHDYHAPDRGYFSYMHTLDGTPPQNGMEQVRFFFFFFFFTLVTVPRRSFRLKLRDTRVCEPQYEHTSVPQRRSASSHISP